MNKTKQQFLRAIRILAAGDEAILEAAQRVREENLSRVPGAAALDFVVAMELSRSRWTPGRQVQPPSATCGHRARHHGTGVTPGRGRRCVGIQTSQLLPIAWQTGHPTFPVSIQGTVGQEVETSELVAQE